MELRDLNTERFDIGRCAVFRVPSWDGTTPLFAEMEHIGTTEGEVDIEANEEFSDLTIEVTGPAILKSYLRGESPSFELGVYPDPEKMRIFSPSGTASAGSKRQRLVRTHTLWIVPEALFLKETESGRFEEVAVTYDAEDGFQKDGEDLTAEDQELLDMSILIWKARFGRMTPRFSHEDGGKSLKTVPVTVMQDMTKPDGAQLYLVLTELEEFEVDFAPAPPPET